VAPPPTFSTPAPVPTTKGLAAVIYPYQAQRDDELTIELNDLVEIVAKGEGWWTVSRLGKTGKVPGNYCTPVQLGGRWWVGFFLLCGLAFLFLLSFLLCMCVCVCFVCFFVFFDPVVCFLFCWTQGV
jgi:Variant SH3 domain